MHQNLVECRYRFEMSPHQLLSFRGPFEICNTLLSHVIGIYINKLNFSLENVFTDHNFSTYMWNILIGRPLIYKNDIKLLKF